MVSLASILSEKSESVKPESRSSALDEYALSSKLSSFYKLLSVGGLFVVELWLSLAIFTYKCVEHV